MADTGAANDAGGASRTGSAGGTGGASSIAGDLDPASAGSGIGSSGGGAPATGGRWAALRADLRDAVTLRATVLVVAVAGVQLAFIFSYVAAFHRPTPHRVPIDVVAPAAIARSVAHLLDRLPGDPLAATVIGHLATARRQLLDQQTFGVLDVPTASHPRLLVASASGPSVATAVEAVLDRVVAAVHGHLAVSDLRPPAPGDFEGLSSFYLVVGWIVGGYLVASLLGVTAGSRPPTVRRAVVRLAVVVVYALVSGFAGAAIVGPDLHALPDRVLELGALGALVVAAAGAFTVGLQVVAGTVGIGLAIVVFVVLGNPSAGGPFGWPLLPAFWRSIGPWIPTGAATFSSRAICYFGGRGLLRPLVVVSAYAVVGAALTFGRLALRPAPRTPGGAPPPASS
jgi:hypothetical protein